MPRSTPMQITLYDQNSETRATFSQGFVPWRLLKAAVVLSKSLDMNNMTEGDVDALAGLVAETFNNRFSIQDLNDGADISEMITVLNQIIGKATGTMPGNPTPPG